MSEEVIARAVRRPKGNFYEDLSVGQMFEPHWGRTLNEGNNSLFTTLTLSYNPLYFNEQYAKEHGRRGIVLNPNLVFLTVFGLSGEDNSESGGLFLGVEDLTFWEDCYPGDTLRAFSTVTDKRDSDSRPEQGIVTWHTEGFNQREERVIDFKRTNFVMRRRRGE